MQSFTLYAIYGVADQWGEEKFDTSLLPFDVAEGVRIEDVSPFIRDGTFKFVETRMGSDDAKELQNTHYALVHRFDATTTFKNGDIVQEDEHNGRSEQLIRKIAACLRLIRPMRQAAQYMQGYVRKDGTFDVLRFQSPANLLEVPDVQKLWHLRDRDADDLRKYSPAFLKAMDGNIWKFKMAVQFHELGHWAATDEHLKARYLLWASAIESIYTSHNPNHQGSKVAKARMKWFLGENTSIYGLGDLSNLVTDPHLTIRSVVDDLYEVRNYLAHGDRIPERYFRDIARVGIGGVIPVYGMLFEAQSFIIRTSLLKILRDGLLRHFADATSSETYFDANGLTKSKLRSHP